MRDENIYLIIGLCLCQ